MASVDASDPVPDPRAEEQPALDSPALEPPALEPPALEPPAGQAGGGGRGWAVCCSGGGIRSASYCLGALQGLAAGGLLDQAAWIMGVSGGSYIAASRALVARNLPADAGAHAYAPGTPEEHNLRDNTRYIAPDGATVLVGVLSLLLGAGITFVLTFAPLYAAAHAWGWLLRWQRVLYPQGGPGGGMAASAGTWTWWIVTAAAAVVTVALFVCWWLTLAPGGRPGPAATPGAAGRSAGWRRWRAVLALNDPDRGSSTATWVGWSALLTAGLAAAMLGVPPVLARLADSSGPFGTVVHFFGFGKGVTWSPAAIAGLITALVAVAQSCRREFARLGPLTGQAEPGPVPVTVTPGGTVILAPEPKPSILSRLVAWLRGFLLPWLGSAAIVAGAGVSALLWVHDGAAAGLAGGQFAAVLIALAVMLLTRIAADVNRMSMHDFYRWRLADAYAVTRDAVQESDPAQRRLKFAAAASSRLSGLADPDGEPGLVICATANINAAREVPPGRGGFSVTFDPEQVVLRGEDADAAAATTDYEALVGPRRLTLFDVSAISGAAISPLMGAATTQAYRILFTATNVRLGVWMPHPAVVAAASERIAEQDESGSRDTWWQALGLLAWYMAPHPLWNLNPGKASAREARLWAHVLRLRRESGADDASLGQRVAAGLWYHAMQPTLGMLWAEAAGHTSYRATWICVTDGGHYDNLGLVEALRRGSRRVLVLDASGDKAGTWFTLGSAIALARTDAGTEIRLDPTTMTDPGDAGLPPGGLPPGGLPPGGLRPGEVVRPWARGTFSGPAGEGELWVCKLGWWRGTPWDIQAYAASHPAYPGNATMEQLVSGAGALSGSGRVSSPGGWPFGTGAGTFGPACGPGRVLDRKEPYRGRSGDGLGADPQAPPGRWRSRPGQVQPFRLRRRGPGFLLEPGTRPAGRPAGGAGPQHRL